MRETTQTKVKKRWPVVAAWIAIGVVTVLFLIVIFFTPLNNAMRSATGQDTPADKIVKQQIINKIEAAKTGDPVTDAKINRAVQQLKTTKMSTIMKAADNQSQMGKLLGSETSLSQKQAKSASKIIFQSGQYTSLRQAVADGKWVKAYQDYNKLSKSGAITALKNNVSE